VRVAAGAIAKKWLNERHGIVIRGLHEQLGPIEIPFVSWDEVDGNPFFAPNAAIVPELEAYMDALRKSGDSIGARINVVASGVPVGLGRAGVRPPGRRHRLRDDGHQRGQGRGDRRRLRWSRSAAPSTATR
jgi:chorismate synthase